MPRLARVKGVNSTYHIIMRGNEKKDIFIVDDDRIRFLETLVRFKEKYNYIIEAYCLMNNHVHLLINDNGNDISRIMKSLNISYAYYFNKIYKRVGHLFQDRFISEIINDDKYLLTVSAYIHNNPVRAGIVRRAEEYAWSSMGGYMKNKEEVYIIDTNRILGCFSTSYRKAVNEYYDFVRKNEKPGEILLDIEDDILEVKRQTNNFIETFEDGKSRLEQELNKRGMSLDEIKRDKQFRKEIMEMLRKNSALTLVEIGKLCGGYAESTVSLILKNNKAKNRP